VIGENPSQFFDISCIPSEFKFQDPSRMGITVKALLSHLRDRQKNLGVNAFNFHHVLRNNKLEPAEYPEDAQAVITGGLQSGKGTETGAEVVEFAKTPTKVKSGRKGSRSPVKTPRGKVMKASNSQLQATSQTMKNEDLKSAEQEINTPAAPTPTVDNEGNSINMQLMPPSQKLTGITSHEYANRFPTPFGNPPIFPNAVPITFPADASNGAAGVQTQSTPMPVIHPGNQYPPGFSIQQMMSYMLQHMAEGNTTPSGIGYHLGQAEQQPTLGNIDPQLLPAGPPTFSNISSHSFPNQHQAIRNDGNGFVIIPSAPTPDTGSRKRTPKRKRSQDDRAELTPTRSNRKRKPTQKYLDSLEMINN
jgi:hypothetical protein